MKRIAFALTLLALVLIASCKKNNSAASAGSWSFIGAKYAAETASYTSADSSLDAGSDAGMLSVFFPSATVTSGSYLIANYDSVPLRAGQVYIRFINTGTSQYYFSTGADSVSAHVTISPAGKITVAIPAVYLESYANPVPVTAQLSGTISQQ